MSHKETYAEYTQTFPLMVEELRKRTFHPDGVKYASFIFDNENAILETAKWFASRGRYRWAAELLVQGRKLISEIEPEKAHLAWATKFYIQQILAMRGTLTKKHWRKVMKSRAKYLDQALRVAEAAGVEAKALTELREWRDRVADVVEKAEVSEDYRIAAQLLSRLGGAADLILMGKCDVAYAHLVETITTLAALDEGDKE